MKTSELTFGEKLKLDRRRRGESQKDAAARWGMTLYAYRLAETGPEIASHKVIKPGIRRVHPYESCYLLRVRAGISVQKMAKRLDVSEWWLIQMEHGREDSTKLVEHWAA